jgi:endonuclease YncB( thermonuclease family)
MGKVIGFNGRNQHKGKTRRRKGRITGIELALTLFIIVAGGLCYNQYQDGVGIWDKEAMANMASVISDVQAKSQGEKYAGYQALVRVVDGDTFWYGGAQIRIADIDTPEIHPPRCAYEAELGMRATRRLTELLRAGPFELEPIMDRDEDKYGRKLRIVVRDGQSLGDQLVAEGLARRWVGRRMPWC